MTLADEQRARLDAAGAPSPIVPNSFVARPRIQQLIFGGAKVERRH